MPKKSKDENREFEDPTVEIDPLKNGESSTLEKPAKEASWLSGDGLIGLFKVSPWTNALKTIINFSPTFLEPLKTRPGYHESNPQPKPWKEQTGGERVTSVFKGIGRATLGLGKLVLSTAVVGLGAAIAGIGGGLIQTTVGFIQVGSVLNPFAKVEEGRLKRLGTGLKNIVVGPLKLAAGSAIGFAAISGVGAPAIAAIAPVASALASIPYAGGVLGGALTQVAGAATFIHSNLVIGASFLAAKATASASAVATAGSAIANAATAAASAIVTAGSAVTSAATTAASFVTANAIAIGVGAVAAVTAVGATVVGIRKAHNGDKQEAQAAEKPEKQEEDSNRAATINPNKRSTLAEPLANVAHSLAHQQESLPSVQTSQSRTLIVQPPQGNAPLPRPPVGQKPELNNSDSQKPPLPKGPRPLRPK